MCLLEVEVCHYVSFNTHKHTHTQNNNLHLQKDTIII